MAMGSPLAVLCSGAPEPETIVLSCADDVGVVVSSVRLPPLAVVPAEVEVAVGLALDEERGHIVPLLDAASDLVCRRVRRTLSLLVRSLAGLHVSDSGRYLGFELGPGGGGTMWEGCVARGWADVKKVHLEAGCEREYAYADLPPEDTGRLLRKLQKWLCDMRGAARGWEKEYAMKMKNAGFVPGKYASTVFKHQTCDLPLRCPWKRLHIR